MSTRATYEFRSGPECWGAKSTTFYIHHDGYPEGAADYFAAALAFKPEAPNSNFADCFYRANSRAELTAGHDAHGDTDYQYTVTQAGPWRELFDDRRKPPTIEARKVVWSNREGGKGTLVFAGTVQEFVAQYAAKAVPQ